MPVSIDRVETEIDLRSPPDRMNGSRGGLGSGTREEQLAALRPLVLEVLDEELDRINRRHGG